MMTTTQNSTTGLHKAIELQRYTQGCVSALRLNSGGMMGPPEGWGVASNLKKEKVSGASSRSIYSKNLTSNCKQKEAHPKYLKLAKKSSKQKTVRSKCKLKFSGMPRLELVVDNTKTPYRIHRESPQPALWNFILENMAVDSEMMYRDFTEEENAVLAYWRSEYDRIYPNK